MLNFDSDGGDLGKSKKNGRRTPGSGWQIGCGMVTKNAILAWAADKLISILRPYAFV